MTPAELAFLQALVLSLPADPVVVELGSWKGRSAVAICEALESSGGGRLYAVDAFSGHHGEFAALDPELLGVFRANTAGFDQLEVVVGDSAQAASGFQDGSVDLVFVDADHSYAGVVRDLRAWRPKLKRGGTMAGHDWGWVGVRVAVRETYGRVGRFETIWHTRRRPGIHPVGQAERRVRQLARRLEATPGAAGRASV